MVEFDVSTYTEIYIHPAVFRLGAQDLYIDPPMQLTSKHHYFQYRLDGN
jgi:hypothetical protein